MSGRAAVFLDRDGTVIRDAHYIGDPSRVELLPGAAAAVRRLNEAKVPVVVVTNQSGIARGLFDHAAYERVRARLDALLAAEGAHVDRSYMCPHHPDFGATCECRKPGTLLYRQAAEQLGIDLERSWYVGDRWRDVLPARVLGGRGLLVPAADTPATDVASAIELGAVAASLGDAVARILGEIHARNDGDPVPNGGPLQSGGGTG
jgi:D-glycero-D-manno-heptose 1,7-bisphosphate phosphatase